MLKPLGALSAADFRVANGLHWVLDIAFQEDASRMRHPITGVAPHGAQSAQTGTNGQVWYQSPATQSRVE
jgi:hypothetical protein